MKTSNKPKITSSIIFSGIVFCAFASFFLDDFVLKTAPFLRMSFLDFVFLIITNIYVITSLFVVIPCFILLIRKQISEVVYFITLVGASLLIGLLLKMVVASQRPSQEMFTFFGPLINSFPSLHTLLVFSMLPLLSKYFTKAKHAFLAAAVLVAFSRIYFGVHYLSDVIWGALIGYGIGWYVTQDHTESKLRITPFELRRKAFHVLFGIAMVTLIFFGYLTAMRLGILLIVGIALSFTEKKIRLPLLSYLLDTFERDSERITFPARGMIMFIAGAFFSVLFFPKHIALASLMVLTLGDAAAHVFGVHFGKVKNPLSEHRFIEGVFAGIIAGFFGALFFVSPLHALVASSVAMLVEAIEFNIPSLQVDDNVLVPLIAGASLLLLGLA